MFKFSLVCVPIILGFSMVLLFNVLQNSSLNAKTFIEENDYRLKFVDSTNFELSLGETDKVIMPLEILDVTEVDGSIIITSHENSVIYSPIACTVTSVLSGSEVELKSNNLRCVISGIISGVQTGNVLDCGDVIGTLKGNTCALKVFWGTKKLTLEELKALL